ncbi:hypothetical protein Acr_22g0006070 [Actinidia rufa]|uniref:Uncharacterized protein n=1 Tax=Actinidia rufa TaxID=165716 RepID=A0A7J0GK68_9ERIC|nr:hypothetical protein Acr_22g0006070 [Actinidia rufa]
MCVSEFATMVWILYTCELGVASAVLRAHPTSGIAVYLTQEVINNAFVDLDPIPCEGGGIPSSAYSKASNGPLLQPCQKKRKHASTTASLEEDPDRVDLEVGVAKNPTPLSVKIAALEAIETLLTVGGALGAESWRPSIDRLLITVATNGCKGGWAEEEKHIFVSGEPVPTWADFQLAALRALLASLLSPARFRPANLSRGLELFRRGGYRLSWEGKGTILSRMIVGVELELGGRKLDMVKDAEANPRAEVSCSYGEQNFGHLYACLNSKAIGVRNSNGDLRRRRSRVRVRVRVRGSPVHEGECNGEKKDHFTWEDKVVVGVVSAWVLGKIKLLGMRETGTKLAEFCAHALLALEVLIHPRALSLIDFSPSHNGVDGFNRLPDVYSYGNKQNTPFSSEGLGKGPGDSILGGDDLYESWLANDDEIENPVIESGKDKSYPTEKPSETLISDPSSDKINPVADSSIARVFEERVISSAGERIEEKGNEVMGEEQEVLEPIKQAETMAGMVRGHMVAQWVVAEGSALDSVEVEPPTSRSFLAAVADSSVTGDASTSAGASDLERSKHFSMDLERESSVDSLPDIVDGDPDSD